VFFLTSAYINKLTRSIILTGLISGSGTIFNYDMIYSSSGSHQANVFFTFLFLFLFLTDSKRVPEPCTFLIISAKNKGPGQAV